MSYDNDECQCVSCCAARLDEPSETDKLLEEKLADLTARVTFLEETLGVKYLS